MTNLETLCKQLNLQGGTIHDVADSIGLPIEIVLSLEFAKCPTWAKGIKYPKLVSPCGDYVESIKQHHITIQTQLYLDEGWRFCK
jgi:hypothetical protein